MIRRAEEEGAIKLIGVLIVVALIVGMVAIWQFRDPDETVEQELTMAQVTDIQSEDIHRVDASPDANVLEKVVETLYWTTPEGDIEPLLAEELPDVSDDGLTWTVELREDVEFHDGEEFNAQAVKENFDRIRDPDEGAPFAFLLAPIEEVDVVDDYTVEFRTEEPYAPMERSLAHAFMGIQSPAAIDIGTGEHVDEPVGTGPFEWVYRDEGEEIKLERNEDYWGDVPEIEELNIVPIPEDGTRMAALEAGDVDIASTVPPERVDSIDEDPEIDVEETGSVRTIYVGKNQDVEPLNDQSVRQAINYAVDQEAIVEHLLEDVGRVSDAPISQDVFGHSSIETYEHDPDKAVDLLEEAGYDDDIELTLTYSSGRYMKDGAIAEQIQAELDDVGIDVELEDMEWGSYMEFLRTGEDHELYLLGWGSVTFDADYGLYDTLRTGGGFNYGNYSNPEVDDLLDEARATIDPDEREDLYEEAMEIIMDDAPWLFLHSEGQRDGIRTNVEGAYVHTSEVIYVRDAEIVD